MLMSVEAGSPAGQAGLLQGDVLLNFDGQPVQGLDALQALLGVDRVGKSVPVQLARGGQLQTLNVTVGQG
jgi:S1-C subfamily serine protease